MRDLSQSFPKSERLWDLETDIIINRTLEIIQCAFFVVFLDLGCIFGKLMLSVDNCLYFG